MANQTHQQYKAPAGVPSSVGDQIRTDYHKKGALIEARRETYFMQLGDNFKLPKNTGKKIKRNHVLPILDDRNINDQGIDAAGVIGSSGKNPKGNLYGSSRDAGTVVDRFPTLTENGGQVNRVGMKRFVIESSLEKQGFYDKYTQESLDFDTQGDLLTHINRELLNAAVKVSEDLVHIDLLLNCGVNYYMASAQSYHNMLSKASLAGLTATNDWVLALGKPAGTVKYGPAAKSAITNAAQLGTVVQEVTYKDRMRLSMELTANRCPKNTTIITGTRNIDTKVIAAARYMYIGPEVEPTLRAMKDPHNAPAFIPVEKYAAGTTLAHGEIGSINGFRFIVHPEMLHFADAGAAVASTGMASDGGSKVNVYPMLVIGDKSFATIGFQTVGGASKFTVYHRPPGQGAMSDADPYGETGLISIKWYYGFMALRPERLACLWTAVKA